MGVPKIFAKMGLGHANDREYGGNRLAETPRIFVLCKEPIPCFKKSFRFRRPSTWLS